MRLSKKEENVYYGDMYSCYDDDLHRVELRFDKDTIVFSLNVGYTFSEAAVLTFIKNKE